MEDPIITNEFFKKIINIKKDEIIGIYISKLAQLKTRKKDKDLNYALALIIIAGFKESSKQILKMIGVKLKKLFSKINNNVTSGSIKHYALKNNIKVYNWNSLNNQKAIEDLKKIKPDVIIHQTQEILKKDFLSVPKICVLNRHNALLPNYRGRLAPFWAVFKGEKETGVTIHTVTEEIDKGKIILQEKIPITKNDDYVSVTKKCYAIAPDLMIEAIDSLPNGYLNAKEIEGKGSYYSTPTIKDAFRYRKEIRRRHRNI